MKKNSKFALGIALAAGIGYVAGVLTAPKSGKETREDIKTAAIKSRKQIEEKLKVLHSELNAQLKNAEKHLKAASGRAKTELANAVKKAQVAKDKARDMLSALHEGEAEDQDLDNAVKDLKTAIANLKKFAEKPTEE